MTVSTVKGEIESALAEYFGRKFCCLTNRGTTALTAALAALDKPRGTRAVFPAAMCSIPVFAARFAGWTPAFADVNAGDGNFDLADLELRLAEHAGRTGAVVPVHMFGRPDRIEELNELCVRHGAALVEDLALSMGARYNGRRAGSFGRLACLSFVRKMLPLEMGGAVLTDEPGLDARVRAFVDRLPPAPPGARDEVRALMKAFHSLTGYVAAGGWRRAGLLAPFEKEFETLLLARTDEQDWRDSVALAELAALEDAVAARRARAEVLETALSHSRLKPLRHEGSCFFAFPVRLEGVSAEAFLQYAASRGFEFRRIAYPDVHKVFGAEGVRPFPGARTLEKEVVGFPVDDDQPVSSFWGYAQDFVKTFEEYLARPPERPPFDWEGRLEMRMS
jgi:dTDP-4-amino-4,6-dideoxygalactose transaminase